LYTTCVKEAGEGAERMPRKPKQSDDGKLIQFETIKARLYPTPEQAELFEKTFGCCRYIWNRMLSDHDRFYEETGVHFIPTPAKYKAEAPFLKDVDNQALTQEYNRLAQAFRVFFKNPESFGYPRLKRKKDERNSFSACTHRDCPTIYITRDGIRMTKAGVVKAVFPKRPRNGWTLKRITVEKTKSGKYFCCILYEYPVKIPEPIIPTEETTIGLKYSLKHFYVADDGGKADPPKWMRQSQDKLAELQRKLSRMQLGSKNYMEAVQKYRELHEHIANQRRDYIHKESRRIANAWNAVCVRADDLAEMAGAMPHGGVSEAGFGMFREFLTYKLERQGKELITVDRYYPSSRICGECGHTLTASASYKHKTWVCPKCGLVNDREVNAAKNIKAQGLSQYFNLRELRESA